jgi:APA family basic amino acid/polyamine antiporter
MLNYYGQGALLLRDPSAASNPFYLLAPDWFLYPLVAIATAAAIVASQAMISGGYSLAQQCVQLGYSPRLTIVHTSYKQAGQIYVPEVNTMIAVGCIALVGFSLYFSIGVVANFGLGLTPLIFLAAGLLLVLAALTYVEGGGMYGERGGSSSFARHAFNELASFIAGWAILIDYIIIVALAALAVAHYLGPIWDGFTHGAGEIAVAAVVIALAAAANIGGFTRYVRQRPLIVVALADIVVQAAVIVAGAIVVFDPDLLTQHVDLFTTPSARHLVEALAVATLAFAGVEAASDLAPDFNWRRRDLRRVVGASALLLPLIYAGMAAIALMALPVVTGPDGAQTPLGGEFIEDPILGIVMSYDPHWLSVVLQIGVVAVAPIVLAWAAGTSMLGLSRHVYALATNRQVPSWLGKLSGRSTPYVAILVAAVMSLGLAIPGDVRLLAEIYAFGATLAIAIAHLSIVRLRWKDPERERPYRIPFNIRIGERTVPLPALVGAVLMLLLWVAVMVFHARARWVGGGWMVFGLVAYVIYRRFVEGTTLTKRVFVPEEALRKEVRPPEYANILVPVFGTKLDDDIVGTAGRLADAADDPGEEPPRLQVMHVMELPLTVPLDAPPPPDRLEAAKAALQRAKEVAEEYETVDVQTDLIPARSAGAAIVQEARKRGVEAIVMGAEPPSRMKGGAVLGGVGGSRPPEIGPVTEYVLKKAPCPVLLTAPPEG